MKLFAGLSEIESDYSAIFCDVWGVIRDGHALLPEAIEALQNFRNSGKPVVLVSNSPRPYSEVARQLGLMGAPDNAWDAVVTSGDATRLALQQLAPGPFFKIGPDGLDDRLYDGLGLSFSDMTEARAVVCTGLVAHLGYEPEDYRDLLADMADRKLPMVCANPDIVVQVGDELVWCAGALARLYRELGGQAIISGKPHKPIYELAYRALEHVGWSAERNTVLAIGDGPETDLAGASRMNIDALFIGDGILGGAIDPGDLEQIKRELDQYSAKAEWFASRLIW